MDHTRTPIYSALVEHHRNQSVSLHVPGHKNGQVFPQDGYDTFRNILNMDVTEITGMDDLHHPEGIIEEAQNLASDYFQSEHTYFLVGGSTSGNLAMIMAAHQSGKPFLVQRNCHKSIMHGLELAGAEVVFLSPCYEQDVNRYGGVSEEDVVEAINTYPHSSGLILTYPDYYGRTYELSSMIKKAQHAGIPVLIDEAHGVHFSLGKPLPTPSLQLGADVVVQSAHKMAPALTMGAYLHVNSQRLDYRKIANYLQMFQSSSPSYPIMASLDLARKYLATYTRQDLTQVLDWIHYIRSNISTDKWDVITYDKNKDDPFKLTLEAKEGFSGNDVAEALEAVGIYPELVSEQQVLLVFGLSPSIEAKDLVKRINAAARKIGKQKDSQHATIKLPVLYTKNIEKNAYSYEELKKLSTMFVSWDKAVDHVASASVIPYPPGIPLINRGERITEHKVEQIHHLLKQKVHIQTDESQIDQGIHIYIEDRDKGEF